MTTARKSGVALASPFKNHLQRLQNRAVRIITKRGYEFRSADLLKELHISNLSVRRNNQLCTVMYQVNNGMVPDYLIDLFKKTNTLHGYETRQAEFNFLLPKPNTNFRKKSFSYRGALAWNDLVPNLKNLKSLNNIQKILIVK